MALPSANQRSGTAQSARGRISHFDEFPAAPATISAGTPGASGLGIIGMDWGEG